MAYIDPNGNVYVDDGSGGLLYVPNVDTANALGVDWNNLTPIDSPGGNTSGTVQSVDTSGSFASPGQSVVPAGFDFGSYIGQDVIDPSQNVYRYDGTSGTWKHIPDPVTANAMGVNWQALTSVPGQPQPFGGDWPEYVVPVTQPQPSAPTPKPSTSGTTQLVSEHGAGQGTPAPGAINVNEQAAALGLPPLVPVAAAPINPEVVRQEAAAYTQVVEWQGEDIEPGDHLRTLQSAEESLRNIIPSNNLFGYDLPDSIGGNQTAKKAFRSLMTTLSKSVVPSLQSSLVTSDKLRRRIGG